MKICLINHSFPPQIGGGETHIFLLARGFVARGHEVTVVTSGDESSSSRDEINGFFIIRIKKFGDFEKGLISFRHVLEEFRKAFLNRDFDVVHVHNFLPGLAYASISALVKTKKVVFTFHSTPIPDEGKIIGHFTDYDIEKVFASFIIKLPFYDKLVCPSQYYYDWALKLGADKNKLDLVYHGVNEEDFSIKKDLLWRSRYGYDNDDFIIVCPARMIHRKGIIDLIKAIKIIQDKRIKLLIPTSVQNGSVEYLDQVNSFINENNLVDRVNIIVDKENIKTMPQVFANCNICVLPSHIEGLGITLLEAMAAGIPVIGSDTYGINEVIRNGINGLLSKVKDPIDLANKILRIKKDSELARILTNGGKLTIRSEFSLVRQLRELESIYK